LFEHIAAPQPVSDDRVVISNSSGCSFAGSGSGVMSDIAEIPVIDFWGNNLNNGYLSVNTSNGGTTVDSGSIDNATINAADSAAFRIRAAQAPGNGAPALPGVLIFGIGLGGSGAASDTFMRRVTNDPSSPIFDASAPEGLYVYAPTAGQLSSAFDRIASEILRLAD
jgi:hypothetical protein